MKFSIIIPTFNREDKIQKSINSVLKQTIEDSFEIIIVDDGSTDNTEKVVKSYRDSKIQYVKLAINSGGPNRPKNIGSNCAKGEWLIFLDSDDTIVFNSLNEINKILNQNNKIDLLFSACKDFNGNITSNNPNYNGFISTKKYFQGKVSGEYLPIVRKNVFDEFLFIENIIGGEGVTWKLISKSYGVYISNYVARIYDNHGENRVSTKNSAFFKRVLKCHLVDLSVHWKTYLLVYPNGLLKLFVKIFYYSIKS